MFVHVNCNLRQADKTCVVLNIEFDLQATGNPFRVYVIVELIS